MLFRIFLTNIATLLIMDLYQYTEERKTD